MSDLQAESPSSLSADFNAQAVKSAMSPDMCSEKTLSTGAGGYEVKSINCNLTPMLGAINEQIIPGDHPANAKNADFAMYIASPLNGSSAPQMCLEVNGESAGTGSIGRDGQLQSNGKVEDCKKFVQRHTNGMGM